MGRGLCWFCSKPHAYVLFVLLLIASFSSALDVALSGDNFAHISVFLNRGKSRSSRAAVHPSQSATAGWQGARCSGRQETPLSGPVPESPEDQESVVPPWAVWEVPCVPLLRPPALPASTRLTGSTRNTTR